MANPIAGTESRRVGRFCHPQPRAPSPGSPLDFLFVSDVDVVGVVDSVDDRTNPLIGRG